MLTQKPLRSGIYCRKTENQFREKLLETARRLISSDDPSHDLAHALRVLTLAERIAKEERGADLEVIVPSALFHDLVNHPKNDPKAANAPSESAALAIKILQAIDDYPRHKIEKVATAIRECAFNTKAVPRTIESQILQDADRLEATGAIAIMRTFSSTGTMSRPFYHLNDPFCEKRLPNDREFALDLFFTRLLKVVDRLHTSYARAIAQRRAIFLNNFLDELRIELYGDDREYIAPCRSNDADLDHSLSV